MPFLVRSRRSVFLLLGCIIGIFSVALVPVLFLFVQQRPDATHPVFLVGTVEASTQFRTQTVDIVIPQLSFSASATAPVDFSTVDPAHTILLISSTTQSGSGIAVSKQTSARVELVNGSTITATRGSSNDSSTLKILLIEYKGSDGGANEFIVRDRRNFTWPDDTNTQSFGPIVSVVDTDDVVVFPAGVSHNGSGDGYRFGLARGSIDGTKTVNVAVGDADLAGLPTAAFQTVEFTGSNWTVQSGTVANPAVSPGATDVGIASVGSIENAWIYHSLSTNPGITYERSVRSWLTSDTNLRIQSSPDSTATKTVQWYVLSNPELFVQSDLDSSVLAGDLTGTYTGFDPVHQLSRSFAWVDGFLDTSGAAGANTPGTLRFDLASPDEIALIRSQSGYPFYASYQVVEFPRGLDSGDASGRAFPHNLSVAINGGSSCTSLRTVSVSLESVDARDAVIGNSLQFDGSVWELLDGNPTYLPWQLEEGDGMKTIFVLFRSFSGDLSVVQVGQILLDEAGGCRQGLEDEMTPSEPAQPTESLPEHPPPPPAPVEPACTIGCKDVSYDLYLVNPDGRERRASEFARFESVGPGLTRVSFEDSVDMDYNDVVLLFDRTHCPYLRVTRESVDADFHHRILLRVLHDGAEIAHVLLWQDSKAEDAMTIGADLTKIPGFCPAQ